MWTTVESKQLSIILFIHYIDSHQTWYTNSLHIDEEERHIPNIEHEVLADAEHAEAEHTEAEHTEAEHAEAEHTEAEHTEAVTEQVADVAAEAEHVEASAYLMRAD